MTAVTREGKLNSILAHCEQLYERLRRIIPDLRTPDLSSIPDDRKRLAATAVYFILEDLKEADRHLRQASMDIPAQGIARKAREFYRTVLLPNREQLETLLVDLLDLPDIDIDLKQLRPEPARTPVWNILVSGLDFWNLDESGEFSAEDLAAADHLLFSSFFRPDEWLRGFEELQPILGERAEQRIPGNVRERLKELYRSFAFGNFLSAIALARAILEYALVDRASHLGIDPYTQDTRYPGRTRRLRELVEDAAEKIPELRSDIESILDAGNQTLHPRRKDNLVRLPSALRAMAFSSTLAVRAVVERLYVLA